ncbi:uncharacterized protein BJ171DRAFT_441903 [Polychytrium aggregatum]|uniref:uncharacterized protein n=1 Tax=Polychytrium aggregatum TaxID=110093 RepID=UPI0022FEB587|nr:uncharacterized protein BJ171DRAFT_441903 [Polychytrium aggregatum]KAI9205133.1 hypothetical protein BJ171DRAFT_441903 [Polychytrium aggregatum]
MKKPVVDNTPKRIKQLEFGVFSSQAAMNMSVLELYERNLYDVNVQGPVRAPAPYGVLDKRLGTSDKQSRCETCGENLQDCVGHFGVIRLVLPVFHIGYFKQMIKVLQNICKTCSRVLLEEQVRRVFLKRIRSTTDGNRRNDILKSLNTTCKKATRCPHCNSLNGTVKKVGAMKIVHEKFRKRTANNVVEEREFRERFTNISQLDPALKPHISKAMEDMTPLTILRLLERISNEDCELMGLDPSTGRPELFLWTALPVPPVCIRPSVGVDASSSEDDLTVLLSDIIDINSKIRAVIAQGLPTASLMEHWDYLQLQCAMYVTSDLPGVPHHLQSLYNVRKIKKGFCQRLKGKHGRFRGNLSGKRVDFSGRTVISPDPNLRIDQVAVPERICRILTYPERVTAFNIERLRKNVMNGVDVHPGATYVTSSEGYKRFLKFGDRAKVAQSLQIGDIVDRHLQDDDIVLFNRQPSLHKLSIMSHMVKVRPWRTLRFNECVCTPYNADFDGDEMNIHVPQTEEARAEAITLMGVKNNLVTPRNGEPLIAATQDFITASYLISSKDTFYDRSQFTQVCSYLSDATFDIDIPPPAIWKPVKLWTGKQIFSVLLRPNKKSKVILNLETKCRTFEKDKCVESTMCPSDGYLFIYNSELMCGVVDKAIIGDGSKKSMFYTVLRDYGPIEAAACMNRVAKLSARWLANKGFSIGIDDVQPGEILAKQKDIKVVEAYARCDELIGQAKAGKLKLMAGCNEAQTLESEISGVLSKVRDQAAEICLKELSKYNAPLIMSLCGSKGSKINVSQMVACVGQQIISGNRIPNGFGDRSLPHFPKQSVAPAAKGFVRNSFYSGLTPPEFIFHAVSGREGLVDTAVKTAETGYMSRRLMKALEDLTAHYDRSVRNASGGVVQFVYGDDGLDPASIEGAQQPVEFVRNLQHSRSLFNDPRDKGLLPYEVEQHVNKALDEPRFKQICSDEYIKTLRAFISDTMNHLASVRGKHGLGTGLESGSKSKKHGGDANQIKTRITKKQLECFLDICATKYARAVIEPGTAVGAVGAQSIGEPGTQMTLKTFHFAGVASMNVTLGVPRIKEIINAAKTISTPIITAILNPKTACSESAARVVKGRVEKTRLEDISEYIQEIVSAQECYLRIKLDEGTIHRLQLDLDVASVCDAIVRAPKLKISSANIAFDGEWALRVRVSEGKNEASIFHEMQVLKRALPKVVVKGIRTVNRAIISEAEGKKPKEYQLLVEGYGLMEVMGTDGVDGLKTKSNHTLEVFKTLGIEAARLTIIKEIMFTMSSHGMTIDPRHVMLLSDLMTFKGEVLGITRFGIAKMRDSVLMLASFEKTTDHLFDASFFGKKDEIMGVSECIIMGQPMGIGTGLFKLIQRTDVARDMIPKTRSLLFDEQQGNLAITRIHSRK